MRNQSSITTRRLRVEALESRQMLAADVALFHNFQMPEDVDGNGVVAPIDALRCINALSGIASNEQQSLLDVNADGRLTPLDPLIVLNGLNLNNGQVTESAIPLARRISMIRDAIESNRLPARFAIDRASEILETLEHGGRPELGEVITSNRLQQLRQRLAAGDTPVVDTVFGSIGVRSPEAIVQRVESVLQELGIDIRTVVDVVQGVREALPEETSQVGMRLVEILDNLGSDGQQLGDQVGALLDSPAVASIVEQIQSTLSEAGIEVADLSQQVRSFVVNLASDGVPIRDALLGVLNRDPSDPQSLRDELVRILNSEALDDVRATIQSQLNNFGIEISDIQRAIHEFTGRLAAGETPVQDWIAGLISSSQPASIAERLLGEADSLGANVENLIDDIVDDVSGIGDSVRDFVSSISGGSLSVGELVDSVLDDVRSGGSVSDILDSIFNDVDGFLDNLFAGDGFLGSLFGRFR